MKKVMAFILAVSALLAGCKGSQPGGEFLGKWQSEERSEEILRIERNGESFLVHLSDKRGRNSSVPGTYRDGIIEMKGLFGTTVQMVVNQNTGKLTVGRHGNYKKVE